MGSGWPATWEHAVARWEAEPDEPIPGTADPALRRLVQGRRALGGGAFALLIAQTVLLAALILLN